MYYLYGISVLIILLIAILWKARKTGKRYGHLPTYRSIFTNGIYQFLTNISNSHSITSTLFQEMDSVSKQLENEGIFYVWCFIPVLIVFSEDSAKIFATNEACADKSTEYYLIKNILGEGLITSNGETWRKDRKMLNPVFHSVQLKNIVPILNENARILVTKLAEEVDKPTANLCQSLHSCTFHNLCESILGTNMKGTISETEIEDFFEVLSKLEQYVNIFWLFPKWVVTLLKYCTPFGWTFMKYIQNLKQFGRKLHFRMKESLSCKSSDSRNDANLNQKSVMSILVENPSFTVKYVQEHILTFTAAGTETVANTTLWCLFLLGLHKDIQQMAADEIQSVAKEFITYENLFQLEYLESIIKETLRLYPTVPTFGRYLTKDLQCGKYKVPKDTLILFLLYRLHRNAEIYPDPENFNPDRFRSGNADERKWAYLPFSEGYRSCIGKKFAMMQIKVILANILRNYEIITLDKREDIVLTWEFLLVPTRPLRMRLTRRKLSSEDS